MAKVLIVEDDAIIMSAYQMALKREGHLVITATNGAEALGMAMQGQPQVILLDMLLPKVSGLEFLKLFGPHRQPATRIVSLTNIEDQRREAYELGVDEYWVKSSFTPKEVVQKLAAVLAFD